MPAHKPITRVSGIGPLLAAGIVAALTLALVVAPLAWLVLQAARGVALSSGWHTLPSLAFVNTFRYPAVIALLATALAWPSARALAARPGRSVGLLAAGVMPSYLAYAGWGLARAPGTWLGDAIARAGSESLPWLPMGVGRALAVVGLALWAWPLATLVLAPGVRAIDRASTDPLRLEAGPVSRVATEFRLLWRSLLLAAGAVFVLMLGSAVPLHVAQARTLALEVWLELAQGAGGGGGGGALPPRALTASWPLVCVAVVAGLIGARCASGLARLWAESAPSELPPDRGGARWAWRLTWTLAVLGPVVLFALHVRDLDSLRRFWSLTFPAMATSLAIAGVVAAVAAAVVVCAWTALAADGSKTDARACWTGRLVSAALTAALVSALMPGVLIGAAWGELTRGGPLAESSAVLVVAHLTRFLAVPLVVALVLARTESETQRAQRQLDGAEGFVGMLRARGLGLLWLAIGGGGVAGLLSLHEIEASVMLVPPGVDHLPTQLLNQLHFARDEDLSAAVLYLMAPVLLFGLLSGAALARFGSGERPSERHA